MPTGNQESFGFADSMQKSGGYEGVQMNDESTQKTAKALAFGDDAAANASKDKSFETPTSAPYAG